MGTTKDDYAATRRYTFICAENERNDRLSKRKVHILYKYNCVINESSCGTKKEDESLLWKKKKKKRL